MIILIYRNFKEAVIMKATKTGYALITSAIAILTIVVGAFSL